MAKEPRKFADRTSLRIELFREVSNGGSLQSARPGNGHLRQEWKQALAAAQQYGWQPAGTASPPVSLDSGDHGEWSGDYHPATGQEVRRDDARRLAKGLATAIACQADAAGLPDLTALIDFTAQSGSIL